MWHVYRSEDNVKSDDFYFAESKPLSALRYAFILRKRTGAIIPKAIYNKLMAEVKAMRPQAESAPAQQESQPAAAEVGEAPAPEAEPSPIARQYSEMKAKHSDAILLFRVGDFYESFGDDAVAVSDILGLTLTRRSSVKAITYGYPLACPHEARQIGVKGMGGKCGLALGDVLHTAAAGEREA